MFEGDRSSVFRDFDLALRCVTSCSVVSRGRWHDVRCGSGESDADFVDNGGVVFAEDVFFGGFNRCSVSRMLSRFVLDTRLSSMRRAEAADPIFRYLNRAPEKEVPLGSPAIKEVIWSNGYKAATGTKMLGRFEDGSAAVLRHDVGRGHTYLIGVALNDVVRRNQQDRDYEAQRIYANGFEPGTDVWLLILRAWYETYSDTEFVWAQFLKEEVGVDAVARR